MKPSKIGSLSEWCTLARRFNCVVDIPSIHCNSASEYAPAKPYEFTEPLFPVGLYIIISGISSVLSFMASARSIGETTSEYISITVGILTIIITTLQTFTTSFGFSIKMDDFTNSANEYNKIIVELKMKHNQCNTENICQLIKELDQKAIKITYNSKYLPPQWVYEKWTKEKNKYGGPNGGSEVGSPSRNLIKPN